VDHFPYLFAAYTIVWIVVVAWVVTLDRRARRAEREVEELRRLVERGKS
jgi:CcmD family protein